MRWLIALLLFLPLPAAADCVVLLHGLARTDASFAIMEEVLSARGYEVYSPAYPSTDLPIPELAETTLPNAFKLCGDQTVHLVSHSMGGILIRYWLKDHRPENLGRVVMLGPPNQGSELVDELGDIAVFGLLNGPAGLQLGTDENSLPRHLPPADYTVGIIAGYHTLNLVFSAIIPGPDDGKVSVQSTFVRGMVDHVSLPVTHTFMMNNPRVIAETLHFLEFERFHAEISWVDAMAELVNETCRGLGLCEDGTQEGEPSR
ncbi:esterase/lipase family protein [Arenibacterium sp. CAU 1754]